VSASAVQLIKTFQHSNGEFVSIVNALVSLLPLVSIATGKEYQNGIRVCVV